MTKNLPVPSENLSLYIQQVNAYPMLTAEEEQEYARAYHYQQNLAAAQKLILSHLRYVLKVAKKYSGYGLPLADLVQEGNIGLMKAVKRFDPEQGVRLVTFAMHWIRAEIHEFVIRNWRMVRLATTKAQRKLFFNLRSHKNTLARFTDEEAQNLATKLNVSVADVREMEVRMSGFDASLDAPMGQEEDTTFGDMLAGSEYYEPEVRLMDAQDTKTEHLSTAIEQLDARSQDIIQARWLAEEKQTLKDLAQKYGISLERVRQLEVAAMKKLKNYMETPAALLPQA